MHLALIKYTVLRLAVFVVSLIVLYAVGVRESILMLVLAAAVSMAVSYLLLRGPRDQLAQAIADRTQHRLERLDAEHGRAPRDEDVEDAAVDSAAPAPTEERSER